MNADAYDEPEAQHLIIEALHQIASELTRTPDLVQLLDLVLQLLWPLVPYDAASAQIYEAGGLRVLTVAGVFADRSKVNKLYRLDQSPISALLVQLRQPLVVDDVEKSRWAGMIEGPFAVRSWLALPLIADDLLLGVITLDRRQLRPFRANEQQRGMAFGTYAALAIRQTQTYRSLLNSESALRQHAGLLEESVATAERQARNLKLLSQVQEAIGTHLHVQPLAHAVTKRMSSVFGYARVAIYLLEEGLLVLQHAVGNDEQVVWHNLGESVLQRCVKGGQPLLIGDLSMPPDVLGVHANVASMIAIPLRRGSQVCGVLSVESLDQLGEEDLRMLETLGAQISVALERAMLYEDAADHAQNLAEMLAELRKAQDDLVQAAKLAAVGTLAAGVAHEFNNLLAGMMGHAELAQIGNVEEKDEALTLIIELARRGKTITRGLLSFARRQPIQNQFLGLNAITDSALRLVEHDLRKLNISVRRNYDERAHVFGDETQLIQVVLNLLTNARDAMREQGGVLTVTIAAEEPLARITISDTGAGIDERVRSRLFEPFVTTKGPLGGGDLGGSGLGLAICYGIVKALGGEIHVESERGRGSTFHILLPLVSQVDGVIELSELPAPPFGGSVLPRRILVVDDEPVLRSLLVQILVRDGHEAVEVADGRAALHACMTQQFDLIISDMWMPGIDGIRLRQSLQMLGNCPPMIIMTGQLEADELARIAQQGLTPLAKPFGISELQRAVRAVLAQAMTPAPARVDSPHQG